MSKQTQTLCSKNFNLWDEYGEKILINWSLTRCNYLWNCKKQGQKKGHGWITGKSLDMLWEVETEDFSLKLIKTWKLRRQYIASSCEIPQLQKHLWWTKKENIQKRNAARIKFICKE
jgi:hypothetical protein